MDSGTNKKKKSKRKGAISNSEAASGGCCFGLFGGNKKAKKPILPEVKEETDQEVKENKEGLVSLEDYEVGQSNKKKPRH